MIASGKRGLLVALEGIDGMGKSTQIQGLKSWMMAAGIPSVFSREPTDGIYGSAFRATFTTKRFSPEKELDLLVKDRREHLREVVEPALTKGLCVVLDRYFYTTIAYQGHSMGDPHRVEQMMLFAPVPDLVFLLDAPAEHGIRKIEEQREVPPNNFEKVGFLNGVRQVFLDLAARRREIIVVDATLPVTEVFAIISEKIHQALK